MSEIGRQLVTNDRKRLECRQRAGALRMDLLALLLVEQDEDVSEIDEVRLREKLEGILAQKYVMRNLLKHYRELSAAAGQE